MRRRPSVPVCAARLAALVALVALVALAGCLSGAPTGVFPAGATPDITSGETVDLAGGGSARHVGATALGARVQVRFPMPETPADSAAAFTAGPSAHANRYGENRRFWPITAAEQPAVVWQSPESGGVLLTRLAADLRAQTTYALEAEAGYVLAAATGDASGAVFYVLIEAGTDVKAGTREVVVRRARVDGAAAVTEASALLDAGPKGLNINAFGTVKQSTNQVAIAFGKGSDGSAIVGLILARKMHKSADGLNHQGAIGVVLDAESLQVRKNTGQTSGHSFECFLTTGSDGALLGVDLGDNYPRGVNLHRIDDKMRASRVVYTFKTQHGGSPKSPAGKSYPRYEGIESSKPLYQWSNDNSTYTEIGGVVETSAGLVVVFAGEADRLDNTKATSLHNSPRDIGAVLVRGDFSAASKGKGAAWVSDDLVLSSSDYTMEGGYYSFGGKWLEQRNAGVLWHTAYADKDTNASRVKVLDLGDDRALVLWELWSGKVYLDTMAMVLGAQGKVVKPPASLGVDVRLGRRTDPFLWDGKVVVVGGDAATGELVLDTFWAP